MIPGRPKSGMATLVASAEKLNAGPYHFQSNKIYCRLCLTAKSILAFAPAVVCVITRMILPGFIQRWSFIFEDSFRFKIRWLFTIRSPGFSATIITRQGVPTGEMRSAGVYILVRMVLGLSAFTLNLVR